jgi:nucleotide-binding universal stress UspA family protein
MEYTMRESPTPPAVVVGIDGSRMALGAALWAVDEAVSRDVPLRLLCAVDQHNEKFDPHGAAQMAASAEAAVRYAFTVNKAPDKLVKIEVEITQGGSAVGTLIHASRSAALLCVGAVGFNHFQPGRVGSTAAALAAQAHCPVAVIRHHDGPARRDRGVIVVVVDQSPDDGCLLETTMKEARLRQSPVRVVTGWHSRSTGVHDNRAVGEGNRRLRAELDRRLMRWSRRYPDVEVTSVPVHGSVVSYLAKNSESVQLVIVSARDRGDVKNLVGPSGDTALHHSNCSVLIVGRQHL